MKNTFCKVTSYLFHDLRIANDRWGKATDEYNLVVREKTPTLLNIGEIMMVVPDRRLVTFLADGWKTEHFENQSFVVPCKEDVQKFSIENNFVRVPDSMKHEVQFYKVFFKHPIPHGLGLNGVSYDQYVVIDEESWEHLRPFLEGDNSF